MPAPFTYRGVQGRVLKLSNLGKVFYPETGFTKGDLLEYYRKIAPVLLPHLRARPVTLKRYPEGIGSHFYEKRCPYYRPKWLKTIALGDIAYCALDDLPSLLWAANLGTLELHTSLCLQGAPEEAGILAFDLDPGAPATLTDCAALALRIRSVLRDFGLESFPKISGMKGMQLYVPLNRPTPYERTKDFAHALARRLEREQPDRVVSRMSRKLRPGKILIDWSQNDGKKTTVCVYSLRAASRPSVSAPLRWTEVKELAAGPLNRSPGEPLFPPQSVLERVHRHGDLFEDVLQLRQQLPSHRALERAA